MAPELSIGLCGLFLKNNKLEVKIRVIIKCYQLVYLVKYSNFKSLLNFYLDTFYLTLSR